VVYRITAGDARDWLATGMLQEATGGTLPAVATFAQNIAAFFPAFSLHALDP
jgi:hypothetical protein